MGILDFLAAPACRATEMPAEALVSRAKSYGGLKTFKNLGKMSVPCPAKKNGNTVSQKPSKPLVKQAKHTKWLPCGNGPAVAPSSWGHAIQQGNPCNTNEILGFPMGAVCVPL